MTTPRYRCPEPSYFELLEYVGVRKAAIQAVIDRWFPERDPGREVTKDEFREFLLELIDLV